MDKISAFNERVASLGLNKVAMLYMGAALVTEATETSFKFKHPNKIALAKIAEKIGLTEGYTLEGCDLVYDFSEKQLNEGQEVPLNERSDWGEETSACATRLRKAFYDAGWQSKPEDAYTTVFFVPEDPDSGEVKMTYSSLYSFTLEYGLEKESFNGDNPDKPIEWINKHVGDFYAIGLNENFHKRQNLPQLELDKFIVDLKKYGINVDEGEYLSDQLVPSQSEFNMEKVNSIVAEKSWDKKPIVISNDKVIVDGHHRWKAAFQVNGSVKAFKIDKSFSEIIDFVKDKDYAVYKKLNEAQYRLNESYEDAAFITAKNCGQYGDCEASIFKLHDEEGKCYYNLQITNWMGELVDDDDFELLDTAVAHARDFGARFNPEDVGSLR